LILKKELTHSGRFASGGCGPSLRLVGWENKAKTNPVALARETKTKMKIANLKFS
jgi:hypothetical protein